VTCASSWNYILENELHFILKWLIQGWAKVGLQLFVWKKDLQVVIITVALLITIIIRQIIQINNTIINK